MSPKPPAAGSRECRFPPTLPSGHFPCLQDVGVALFTESHHHPGQVRGPVRPRSELFGESEMSPSWASFFNTLSQAQRSAGRVKHSTTFSSSRRIVSSHYFPLHVMYEIPNSPCARRGRIRRKQPIEVLNDSSWEQLAELTQSSFSIRFKVRGGFRHCGYCNGGRNDHVSIRFEVRGGSRLLRLSIR